jgi:DNA modification methylase
MDKIQLFKGNCLELMKDIPSGSVDAIITDPPYGTTACKWDSVIDFGLMWEQLNRIIKPNGAIVLFGSEPFSSALRMSNIKNYKYDWVWEKDKASNFLNANRQILKIHENISIFYKIQCTYNPQKLKLDKPYKHKHKSVKSDNFGSNSKAYNEDGYSIYTHSYPTSIQRFSKDNGGRGLHPTQKPVALIEYLIRTYTNEGETVLDFTMGSGTAGVACLNTNRNFIGIEMDDNYFSIAEKRIHDHSAQQKLF